MIPKSRKATLPSGVTNRLPAWMSPWKRPWTRALSISLALRTSSVRSCPRPQVVAVVDGGAVDVGHHEHPLGHEAVDRLGDHDAIVAPSLRRLAPNWAMSRGLRRSRARRASTRPGRRRWPPGWPPRPPLPMLAMPTATTRRSSRSLPDRPVAGAAAGPSRRPPCRCEPGACTAGPTRRRAGTSSNQAKSTSMGPPSSTRADECDGCGGSAPPARRRARRRSSSDRNAGNRPGLDAMSASRATKRGPELGKLRRRATASAFGGCCRAVQGEAAARPGARSRRRGGPAPEVISTSRARSWGRRARAAPRRWARRPRTRSSCDERGHVAVPPPWLGRARGRAAWTARWPGRRRGGASR